MVDFIHSNKDLSGVEAICKILPIVASTYYRTLDLVDEKHRFAREHQAKRDLHDEALLHKDLKCKAPLIELNLRRNLGKWST